MLNSAAYLLGNLFDGFRFHLIIGLDAIATESLIINLIHAAADSGRRAAVFLTRNGKILYIFSPVLFKWRILFVERKHFFLKGKVLEVEHPTLQIGIGKVYAAVVLVLRLVEEAVVVAPVVVAELIEHILACRIGDVLEHTHLRIDDTLD